MAALGALPGKGNNTHIHQPWRNLMQSIQFDLYKLGWKAFEDLISCILKETLGQTFQVFSDGVDGGRDGAFYGSWSETSSGEIRNGSFTSSMQTYQ
ncbi:hypothetical protein ACRRGZ_003695 [Escherichia coli]